MFFPQKTPGKKLFISRLCVKRTGCGHPGAKLRSFTPPLPLTIMRCPSAWFPSPSRRSNSTSHKSSFSRRNLPKKKSLFLTHKNLMKAAVLESEKGSGISPPYPYHREVFIDMNGSGSDCMSADLDAGRCSASRGGFLPFVCRGRVCVSVAPSGSM